MAIRETPRRRSDRSSLRSICNASTDTDCRVAGDKDPFKYAKGVIYLVSSRVSDRGGNYALGFGNPTLATNQSVDKKKNPQAARLEGLPAGVLSDVDDQAALDSKTGFYTVKIHVDGGKAHDFRLIIIYPNGTNAPTAYQHLAEDGTTVLDTYNVCAQGETSECFVWNSKTYTATIYLPHNGSLRRTS